MKKILLNVLKISLAVGLIFYLVRNNHIDVAALLQSLSGPQLGLYFTTTLLLYFVMTKRLQLVLQLNAVTCGYWTLLKFNFIGAFFNFALPGSVSGDVVKGIYISRFTGASKARALFSALLDRLVALYTFLLGAALIVLLPRKLWIDSFYLDFFLSVMVLGVVGVTVVGLLAARWISRHPATAADSAEGATRFSRLLREFSLGAQTFLRSPRQVFQILMLSLFGQALYVWLFMIIYDHIAGAHFINYWAHFFVQSVGLIFTAIPISPAGIGVGQAVFHFLYGEILGAASPVGATAISVVQILNLGVGLVGAYFFVVVRRAAKGNERDVWDEATQDE